MCGGRFRIDGGSFRAAWPRGVRLGIRSACDRTRRPAVFVVAVLLSAVPVLVGTGAAAETGAEADLAVFEVSDRPDPVFTGQDVTYRVAVGNRGPSQATSVTVTTSLPAGTRFQPFWSDPRCSEAGGVVTCSFPYWDVNAVGDLLITLTPSMAGVVQQTFTVDANEPDPDLSNNAQTETTQVVEPTAADVSINLPDSVRGHAGQPIQFGFDVQNAGPATATGVTATLRFPAGVTPSRGTCTDTGSGLSCSYSLGSFLPHTASISLLMLTVSAAGSYTVHGSVTSDQPDPVTTNNVDTASVSVQPAADLSVHVADSSDPALPGLALTYTATITNRGPSPALAVDLTDTWDTTVGGGVALLSVRSSQGQCSPTSGASIGCQLGELASGAVATVTVSLRPQGTGTVTATASVSAPEFDPDGTNNTDSETTQVGIAGSP